MAVLQYKYIQISKIIQVGGLNQRLHAFLAAFIDGRDLKRGRKVCCCSHMLARQICRRSYTNKKPAVCSLQTNYSGPVNSPSTVLMDMVSTQNSLFWYLDFVSFGLTKSQDTTRHDMQSFSQAKRRSAWDNEMKSSRSPSLTPPLKAMELAHLNPPKKTRSHDGFRLPHVALPQSMELNKLSHQFADRRNQKTRSNKTNQTHLLRPNP